MASRKIATARKLRRSERAVGMRGGGEGGCCCIGLGGGMSVGGRERSRFNAIER